MPWSWAIAADFQLYIFIPFYVMLYKRSRKACIYLASFFIIAGTVIISLIAAKFDLTAGAYTLENYYMYAKLLNKPYCKLQVHGIGILFCILYIELL
jgi:hypothetical protein